MKKTLIYTLAVVITAGITAAFTGPVLPASVDTKASVINWKGAKVTGTHNGKISLKNGNLEFKDGNLIGGSFEIDMTTITCEDLSGGTAEKLIGHLKSEDFFGVAKYPTSKFVISKVVSRGTPGAYTITGDLTIKSTTKSIKFFADVKEDGGKNIATAKITVDRSDFDVRYGSGSFFDNLGDKTIYDEFELDVKLVTSAK
jgi:polyisoprenoid-binding protein YceI